VRDLCYIKAYWSKMEVRTTVLSVEQERELLKIALEEEKNTVGVCDSTRGTVEPLLIKYKNFHGPVNIFLPMKEENLYITTKWSKIWVLRCPLWERFL